MIHLKVSNLNKVYSKQSIFSGLNFEYKSGILGISGANGSGKTTLMKCLASLLKPTKGEIIWSMGENALNQVLLKERMGYAAPYINLYNELTAIENIQFVAKLNKEEISTTEIDRVINLTEIDFFRDKPYGQLSSGQQQRVKLAVAMVRNPEVIFLDEPGTNLDEKGHQLVSKLVEQAKQNGQALILASNDPAEIALCDQVIQLTP